MKYILNGQEVTVCELEEKRVSAESENGYGWDTSIELDWIDLENNIIYFRTEVHEYD